MASSGSRLITALATIVLLLAAAACFPGGDETAGVPAAEGYAIDLAAAVPPATGAEIAPSPGAPALPPGSRPVGASGDQILVAIQAGDATSFALANPATGASRELWTTPAGAQDIVTAVQGGRAAYVRTGFELPFPGWELHVRTLETGDDTVVARSDAAVYAAGEQLEPGLPLGFAPFATLADDHIAWAEYALEGGKPVRRLLQLDLVTGRQEVVARARPAAGETIESPTAAPGKLAWIETRAGAASFVLMDTATGTRTRHAVPGKPFQLALDATGRYLAWDDGLTAKYALDLESQRLVRFAGDEGWGVIAGDRAFSWAPASAYDGAAGYFDADRGEVHILAANPLPNIVQPVGPWFAWQDPAAGVYRFARVRPGT